MDWTCCFFFSSRRRHTRFKCDWSSDVCSSDLVELLHETRAECDEAKRQLREAQTQAERQAHASRIELEQRYHKLLQEHMQCSVTIARLEAQHAEIQAFMERFRSALRKEEHDQGSSETN